MKEVISMEELNKDVAKEFLMLASYFEEELLKKIPDELFQKLNDIAADSDKEYYVLEDKSLNEQNISEECKDLIALINYLYLVPKSEQVELLNNWKSNERLTIKSQ